MKKSNESVQSADRNKKSKKSKRYEERKRALAELSGTEASLFIKVLGVSPLVLTNKRIERLKDSYPIPREQCVLWADSEFDYRSSGVVCTNRGVFIKTDEHLRKGKNKKHEKAVLYYYQWEDFNPLWFSSKDDNNLVLSVSEECQERFITACKSFSTEHSDLYDSNISINIDLDNGEYQEESILAAAAVESSDVAIFVEHKAHINTPAGHGELAEEANTIIDKIYGLDAKVIGRDNAKDGADRLVNGIKIQTKYYNSSTGSVEACFYPQNGTYRYMDNGKPMQLEVPKDQYEKAVSLFEYKIKQGKVPGVTDPTEAKNIVRKGRLTYKQAVNLSKPGTIESLKYDAATGAVICASAFGITFVTTMYLVWRKTGDIGQAIYAGVQAGVEVFGLSFAQHLLVSQIARTNMAQMLLVPSQYVVGSLGSDTTATIVNGIRALSGKTPIYGAAASKHLAKILRSNVMTSAITFAVFSLPDTYKLVLSRTSTAQYIKNITTLASGIAAGAGGAVGAGIAAEKIAAAAGTTVAPGVGTVVGLAGGFVGGAVGTKVTGAVGNLVYEGDITRLSRLFNAMVPCLSNEYLLDKNEVELLVSKMDSIKDKDFKKLFGDLQKGKNQEKILRSFLTPYFDEIVKGRKPFELPSPEDIINAFTNIS